jgi:hydrogenase nickel incorporation protein HypA/HybF
VHELALMESVVEAVVEQLGPQPVAVVRLEVGALAGVAIDSLRFCFETCVRDTTLVGAELEIISIPARARCATCGQTEPTRSYAQPCSCGSFDRQLVTGAELKLVEVEVR